MNKRDDWGLIILVVMYVLIFTVIIVGTYAKESEQIKKSYNSLHNDYIILKEVVDNLESTQRIVCVPLADFTEQEIYMLAQCVEAEAGINNMTSQKYITQVILNRVYSDKFPNTLKGVIYQKNDNVPQFSVAYNGAMNRDVKTETLLNVYKVLMHGVTIPSNVLYFYSSSVEENWVNTLPIYAEVEGTVFAYSN